jgi:hypothetical protein
LHLNVRTLRPETGSTCEYTNDVIAPQPGHFGEVIDEKSGVSMLTKVADAAYRRTKKAEYSVVQLADDAGWRWEVRFADGKSKSGVSRISRAAAIKMS